MGFEKGHRKTGGRKKGSRNKDAIALEDRARALGIDVFETLAYFAAGDFKKLGYINEMYFIEKSAGAVTMGYTITPEMRLKAVTELMAYIYPKKKSLEMSTDPDRGFRVIVEDYTKK